MYIAFEGFDGVGKSTIITYVMREFQRRRKACLVIGQHAWLNYDAARIIIDARSKRAKFDQTDIVNAYFFDRVVHGKLNIEAIRPRATVIADRSIISDAVYQEALYSISAESTLARYDATGAPLPDVIVYVSVKENENAKRLRKRGGHRQHYEQQTSATVTKAIYDRVLSSSILEGRSRIIRFANDSRAVAQRVRSVLYPQLEMLLKQDNAVSR